MGRVIPLDTHRQALRATMPWMVLALGPLVLSVAAPAVAGAFAGEDGAAPWIGKVASMLGLVGSAAMLIGLLQLSRARASGQRHPAVVLAFAFWTAEFVARMWPLQGGDGAPGVWLGVQLVASSASMWSAATGVIWILRRQQAGGAIASWRRARLGFTALTLSLAACVAAARALAPERELGSWLDALSFGPALAWLAFAAPWILLVLAVRASLRWLGRARSTAEILAR
jgi:hypothetical protein